MTISKKTRTLAIEALRAAVCRDKRSIYAFMSPAVRETIETHIRLNKEAMEELKSYNETPV